MDLLIPKENASEGSYRKVRKLLLQESGNMDDGPKKLQKEKPKYMRKHPWDAVKDRRKRPVERCRLKPSFAASIREEEDDEDLEALSSNHRNEAYDLRSNDPRSKRVYRWNVSDAVEVDDFFDELRATSKSKPISKESSATSSWMSKLRPPVSSSSSKSSQRYFNRRPQNIETKSLFNAITEEPDATTPMTVAMDDDEFDESIESSSFCSLRSFTSGNNKTAKPTQEATNQKTSDRPNPSPDDQDDDDASQGTEVTLDMYNEITPKASMVEEKILSEEKRIGMEERSVLQEVHGKINEHLDEKAQVRRLVQEHERLMKEAQCRASFPRKTLTSTTNKKVEVELRGNARGKIGSQRQSPTQQEELYDSDTGLLVVKDSHQGTHSKINQSKWCKNESGQWGKERVDETKINLSPIKESGLYDSDTGLLVPTEKDNDSVQQETITTQNLNDWIGDWGNPPSPPTETTRNACDEQVEKKIEFKGTNDLLDYAEKNDPQHTPSIDEGKGLTSVIENPAKANRGQNASIHERPPPQLLGSPSTEPSSFQRARQAFESPVSGSSRVSKNDNEPTVAKLNKVSIAAGLINAQTHIIGEQNLTPRSGAKVADKILAMETRLTHASQRQLIDSFFSEANVVERKQKAAILIQSVCRMRAVRREATLRRLDTQRNLSATLIQALWRGYDSRMDYVWHCAAVIVQAWFRSKRENEKYKRIRFSTVKIQTLIRSRRSRAMIKIWHFSASTVQKKWRKHYSRKVFREFSFGATSMQSLARMFILRSRFLRIKLSAIAIQSLFRGFMCRRNVLKTRLNRLEAITIIQSAIRKRLCRTKFLCSLHEQRAATKIQSWLRMNGNRTLYLNQKQSIALAQNAIRMHLCRMQYLRYRESAIILQAAFRATITQARYHEHVRAIAVIQAISRRYANRSKYISQKDAIIRLQTFARLFMARNRFSNIRDNALRVQAIYRMNSSRKRLVISRRATISIQATWRMHTCRESFLSKRCSACLIQSAFRRYTKKVLRVKANAACRIQTTFRQYMQRADNESLNMLQAVHQKWMSSSPVENDYKTLRAIANIPVTPRTVSYREDFSCLLSANIIQRGWNHYCRSKANEACTKIQAIWRASTAQERYRLSCSAATKIQAHLRCFRMRKKFASKVRDLLRIQSTWRCHRCRRDFLELKALTIRLQSNYRGLLCRKLVRVHQSSATLLQSQWRGHNSRKIIRVKSNAAAVIQATWVCWKRRCEFVRRLRSATCIQTKWRFHNCRKEYFLGRWVVIKLQNKYRSNICRKNFTEFKASKCIQSLVRMYLCRKKFVAYQIGYNAIITIQSSTRCFIYRKAYLSMRDSAVLVQAITRMHIARSLYNRTKDIQIAQRETNRRASEERLMALAAKVAKKRAMQKQMEEDKRPKPGPLRIRMAQLEKHSRWDDETPRSTVAKRLSFGEREDVLSHRKFGNRETQSIDRTVSIDSSDDVSGITLPSDDLGDTASPLLQQVRIEPRHEAIVNSTDKASGFSVTHEARWETRHEIDPYDFDADLGSSSIHDPLSKNKECKIVDDLVEDVNAFESDSDSDDSSEDIEGENAEWEEIPDLDEFACGQQSPDEGKDGEGVTALHSAFKEWSIIDDLVDDVNAQLDQIPEMDEGNESGSHNGELSMTSNLNVFQLLRFNHPIWNISTDDVTDACIVTFYTVAAVAASVLGIAD